MHAIRAAYLSAGAIIMAVALSLSLFLGVTSFDIEYQNAYEKLYFATASRMKEFVNQGLFEGKALDQFPEVEEGLADLSKDDRRILSVVICDPLGRVFYSVDSENQRRMDLRSSGVYLPDEAENFHLTVGGNYWFGLKIAATDHSRSGWVVLEVGGTDRNSVRGTMVGDHVFFIVVLVFAGFVCMSFLLRRYFKRPRSVIGVVVTVAQILYGTFALLSIQSEYNKLFLETASRQAGFLNEDAQNLLSQGLDPLRWKDMSSRIRTMLRATDVVREIRILDLRGRVLYSATRTEERYVVNPGNLGKPPSDINAGGRPELLPVTWQGALYAYIEPSIDTDLIGSKLLRLALELGTVLLISAVIAIELARLTSVFIRRRQEGSPSSLVDTIRVTSFVFHIAALVPLSFIPLYLDEVILQTMPWMEGADRQNFLSILMTAYMAGIVVAVPLSAWLGRLVNIRVVLILAASSFAFGTLGTWLLHEYSVLFFMRVLTGVGFGLAAMSGNSLVAALSSSLRYSVGTRSWTTGFSSAAICAFSLGGLIAERFGYVGGMILSVSLMAVATAFIGFFGKRLGLSIRHRPERIKLRDFGEIFKNRDIASLLSFAAFPLQLAMVGLFQYIFPLYMSYRGLDQVDIGRMLAIYGVVNLMAPTINRFREYRSMLRIFVVSGNLIAGIVLVYTFLADNVFVLVVAVAAIGISSMIFDLVMDAFLGRRPGGGIRQQSRALALYTTYERLIASFVPILTALTVSVVGMLGSIAVIGVLSIIGAAAFAFLAPHDDDEEKMA